jgi:hypothetical protein
MVWNFEFRLKTKIENKIKKKKEVSPVAVG